MKIGLSRRAFLLFSAGVNALTWNGLKSFAGMGGSAEPAPPADAKKTNRLFSPGLKGAEWNTFNAAGYPKPVSGICYRTKPPGYFGLYIDKPLPVSGMPLGGIDTGALYLEPSGLLGYTSIFNHLTPVGGPLNTPYLAIASGGRAWIFGTGQTKHYAGNNRPSLGIGVPGGMQESEYWGHYPIADIEYKTDAPVKIGVRSWSPFIPGDAKVSNTPGAVFEVHLRNEGKSAHQGTLVFNFPGFADHHSRDYSIGWPNMPKKPVMPPPQISRRAAPAGLKGVWVEEKSWGMSYVLAVAEENGVRAGGALGFNGDTWNAVEKKLPSTSEGDDGGSSLAVDYQIAPGGEKVIRIILAWYAPEWEGNGNPGTGGERIRPTPRRERRFPPPASASPTCTPSALPTLERWRVSWAATISSCSSASLPGRRQSTRTPRCLDGWRTLSSTHSIISRLAACGHKPKIPLEAGASPRMDFLLWKKRRAPART